MANKNTKMLSLLEKYLANYFTATMALKIPCILYPAECMTAKLIHNQKLII